MNPTPARNLQGEPSRRPVFCSACSTTWREPDPCSRITSGPSYNFLASIKTRLSIRDYRRQQEPTHRRATFHLEVPTKLDPRSGLHRSGRSLLLRKSVPYSGWESCKQTSKVRLVHILSDGRGSAKHQFSCHATLETRQLVLSLLGNMLQLFGMRHKYFSGSSEMYARGAALE